eukprot:TRINITY_DN355_c1_g2_i1.p1 TRINITY_DN355_c1_g2~~TRINITY_DN355_c1_g2_i1.p1  ORF type:complete len:417 (+),score=42.21 TRINITY_DN355_c1_g2_i1:1-1251(+)
MRIGRTRLVSPQERACNESCCRIFLWIVILLLVIGLFSLEYDWRVKNEAYSEVRGNVISLKDNIIPGSAVGRLVFVTSNNILAGSRVDHDFKLEAAGAIKLRRVTEYCQWVEHRTTSEDEEGNKYVTYSYTLGWSPSLIPSILYDQPFRHNNPQRDPYPSSEWVAPTIGVGNYKVREHLVEKISGYQTIYYPREQAELFMSSHASIEDGFKPIGNGYFYSPYAESTGSFVARFAGMFLEGSLDVQLGDFFATCTAGDIRVHYEQIAPTSLSVIGKLVDSQGTLDLFTTKSNYQLGLIQPGIAMDEDEMFDKDLYENLKFLVIFRFFICLILGNILVYYLTPPHMIPEIRCMEGSFLASVIFTLAYVCVHGIGALFFSLNEYRWVTFITIVLSMVWIRHFSIHGFNIGNNLFVKRRS